MALAAAGWLFGAPDAHAQGPTATSATATITPATAEVGQQATVHLQAREIGPPGLGAWTIDITYDSAFVAVAGCTLEHGGICNPGYGPNVVRVTGTEISGLEGDFALANITFVCEHAGAAGLTLGLSVFADATLATPRDIKPAVENGSVTCLEEGSGPPQGLLGDVNCDGRVNSIDATLVLQFVAVLIGALPCIENADVDGDGDIGPIDATLILQKDAGLI
ncbi:MAG: hypothetical protein HY723_01465 [Chloroflexi bacterium]|nr:hypothetical protein [Chloroflexota bacterium]